MTSNPSFKVMVRCKDEHFKMDRRTDRDMVLELTSVYLLKVTGSFMVFLKSVSHWAFGTILLVHTCWGIRPQLTIFCHFAGISLGWCLPDSPKPDSPKPVSPKLGFRVRVRVGVSANRVSAKRVSANRVSANRD